jgi:hypothetical protein
MSDQIQNPYKIATPPQTKTPEKTTFRDWCVFTVPSSMCERNPYRDFELLGGEVVLEPVVDLPLEVLVLLDLLHLLRLLLLIPH